MESIIVSLKLVFPSGGEIGRVAVVEGQVAATLMVVVKVAAVVLGHNHQCPNDEQQYRCVLSLALVYGLHSLLFLLKKT